METMACGSAEEALRSTCITQSMRAELRESVCTSTLMAAALASATPAAAAGSRAPAPSGTDAPSSSRDCRSRSWSERDQCSSRPRRSIGKSNWQYVIRSSGSDAATTSDAEQSGIQLCHKSASYATLSACLRGGSETAQRQGLVPSASCSTRSGCVSEAPRSSPPSLPGERESC